MVIVLCELQYLRQKTLGASYVTPAACCLRVQLNTWHNVIERKNHDDIRIYASRKHFQELVRLAAMDCSDHKDDSTFIEPVVHGEEPLSAETRWQQRLRITAT